MTDKTKMAMPEVGLGFFPDVGGTWLLSRSPGEIGTYFALTGQTMSGADAVYAGAADALIASKDWPALRDALTNAPLQAKNADVHAILARYAVQDVQAPIAQHRELIDRAFACGTLEEIVAALKADGSEFALATLKALSEKSPTAAQGDAGAASPRAQLQIAQGMSYPRVQFGVGSVHQRGIR